MSNPEQRRLRRSAALHGFAVAVFALLALSGAGAATERLYGLAVPIIITGIAGAVGAAVLTMSVWRLQSGADVHANPTQRTTRLAMAAAAVVVLTAGVILAPQGIDRGFVISVAAGLAVTLALFALLSGDRLRTAEQPNNARDAH